MKFIALPLAGAYLIELELRVDERGHFARTFCKAEFEQHGLISDFLQISTSLNTKAGQIRGMHYQEAPYAETKIVRCTRGAIYDVMIDLRKNSPTFNQWYGTELSADNGIMFYIPKGFAHGYKTLVANTEILDMMDEVYVKEAAMEVSADAKYFG